MSNRKSLAGFTLVEMLVVIAIISILAAILVPTVMRAMKTAKEGTVGVEIDELAKAIEQYKQKHGDYPPDFTDIVKNTTTNLYESQALSAHMRAAYSRNARDAGAWLNSPPWPTQPSPLKTQNPVTLDAAEALVFWLMAIGSNALDPLDIDLMTPNPGYVAINGASDSSPLYPFEETRLVDLDGDGWPEYVSQHAPDAPYVYFDGRVLSGTYRYGSVTSRYPPIGHPLDGVIGIARPYRSNTTIDALDNGKTVLKNAENNTKWQEPGKFQILFAGLDGHFGNDVPLGALGPISKQFPDPNYSVQDEDADNIANFTDGRTVEASIP